MDLGGLAKWERALVDGVGPTCKIKRNAKTGKHARSQGGTKKNKNQWDVKVPHIPKFMLTRAPPRRTHQPDQPDQPDQLPHLATAPDRQPAAGSRRGPRRGAPRARGDRRGLAHALGLQHAGPCAAALRQLRTRRWLDQHVPGERWTRDLRAPRCPLTDTHLHLWSCSRCRQLWGLLKIVTVLTMRPRRPPPRHAPCRPRARRARPQVRIVWRAVADAPGTPSRSWAGTRQASPARRAPTPAGPGPPPSPPPPSVHLWVLDPRLDEGVLLLDDR